jgi:hypothetical protein
MRSFRGLVQVAWWMRLILALISETCDWECTCYKLISCIRRLGLRNWCWYWDVNSWTFRILFLQFIDFLEDLACRSLWLCLNLYWLLLLLLRFSGVLCLTKRRLLALSRTRLNLWAFKAIIRGCWIAYRRLGSWLENKHAFTLCVFGTEGSLDHAIGYWLPRILLSWQYRNRDRGFVIYIRPVSLLIFGILPRSNNTWWLSNWNLCSVLALWRLWECYIARWLVGYWGLLPIVHVLNATRWELLL